MSPGERLPARFGSYYLRLPLWWKCIDGWIVPITATWRKVPPQQFTGGWSCGSKSFAARKMPLNRILHWWKAASSVVAPLNVLRTNLVGTHPRIMLMSFLVILIPPLAFAQTLETWFIELTLLLIGCSLRACYFNAAAIHLVWPQRLVKCLIKVECFRTTCRWKTIALINGTLRKASLRWRMCEC